mgnify:CR=1 FL=1
MIEIQEDLARSIALALETTMDPDALAEKALGIMNDRKITDSCARISVSVNSVALYWGIKTEPRTNAMTMETMIRERLYAGERQ